MYMHMYMCTCNSYTKQSKGIQHSYFKLPRILGDPELVLGLSIVDTSVAICSRLHIHVHVHVHACTPVVTHQVLKKCM